MQKEQPILQVENLSISFKTDSGNNQVLHPYSFDLYAGKTIALVGESGSGKSISALALMGLLPTSKTIIEGRIVFKNKNLLVNTNLEWQKIRGAKIAMVFQEPMTSLNPLMRCGHQIMEAIQLHTHTTKEDAKQQVVALFKEVQLPDPEKAFKKYPHEMSGGQKQRVMIAMALSCNPSIIIADEPTTALDVTVQNEILHLLKRIQLNRSMSIIFITHDLALVKNFAEDIVVLYKGKCMEQGNTTAIFDDPKNSYTKALLSCKPKLDQQVKVLPVIADFLNNNQVFNYDIVTEEQFATQLKNKQEIILTVEDLNVKYALGNNLFGQSKKYFHALKNINFKLYKGETLGIIGESGCGKTTLGKTLVKLNRPSSGQLIYKNKDIFKEWDSTFCQEVQIIFQDPYSSLNPRITIGNAIKEPLVLYKQSQPEQQVLQLLEQVGLPTEYASRYPHELSGGQRQRVCIARALAMKAQVIVCDESVSALDVSVQAQVLNLLTELKEKYDLTLVFISHDMSVIRHISDHIMVMQHGQIVEYNDTVNLFKSPKEAYTKILLEAVPKL
jgi:peptide/nickel transport system ATP-binding protein